MATRKVKFTRDSRGSVDGVTVTEYEAGQVVTLSDPLLKILTDQGAATTDLNAEVEVPEAAPIEGADDKADHSELEVKDGDGPGSDDPPAQDPPAV